MACGQTQSVESDDRKLSAEMAVRFAQALDVTMDDLLQSAGPKATRKPSRKVLRRLELIETLPDRQQATLLRLLLRQVLGARGPSLRERHHLFATQRAAMPGYFVEESAERRKLAATRA